jgi:hypothetical protein
MERNEKRIKSNEGDHISFTLNKILTRLESLEGKTKKSQWPRGLKAPNRS